MKKLRLIVIFVLAAFVLACICTPTRLFSPGGETSDGPADGASNGPSDGVPNDPPDGYSDEYSDEGGEPAADDNVLTLNPLTGDASAYDQVSRFAGRWTGTWYNETFGSTGGAEATIDILTDGTASLTVTMTGNVLGAGNAPEVTIPGYYNAAGLFFEAPASPVFGNIWIGIPQDGNFINMTSGMLPIPGIEAVFANGSLTGDEFVLDYGFQFSSGGSTVLGTANLGRAP
jgi:hypothetical protein